MNHFLNDALNIAGDEYFLLWTLGQPKVIINSGFFFSSNYDLLKAGILIFSLRFNCEDERYVSRHFGGLKSTVSQKTC